MKTWLTKVEVSGDEIAVIFPEELIDELNLQDGDLLSWDIDHSNNRVIIHKVTIETNQE
jgi:antitoxin component of MazEF toxin-antitoxin module